MDLTSVYRCHQAAGVATGRVPLHGSVLVDAFRQKVLSSSVCSLLFAAERRASLVLDAVDTVLVLRMGRTNRKTLQALKSPGAALVTEETDFVVLAGFWLRTQLQVVVEPETLDTLEEGTSAEVVAEAVVTVDAFPKGVLIKAVYFSKRFLDFLH